VERELTEKEILRAADAFFAKRLEPYIERTLQEKWGESRPLRNEIKMRGTLVHPSA
jgi:hypothetical protein